MKPLNSKKFWLSTKDFLDLDILQTRASLFGLSFASILTKHPKEFMKLLQAEVSDDQQSILEEMDIQCAKNTIDKQETFVLSDQIFRDSFVRRLQKDVTLEMDNRSVFQHCLYQDEISFKQCTKVQSQIVKHLSSFESTCFNQLTIELAIPDILFHPQGIAIDDLYLLFQDQDDEEDKQLVSFFVSLKSDKTPQYFSKEQLTIRGVKFQEEYESEQKELDKDRMLTKDDQSVRELEHIVEEEDKLQEVQINYCKAYKIDKEHYHILNFLKDLTKEESVFYSHKKDYDDLEHGKHLTKIIEKAGDYVSNLASLRALIDIEFVKTRTYFKYTQLFYTILCTVPFIAVQTLQTNESSYLVPYLIWGQVGQTLFMLVEIADLLKEDDWYDYFLNLSNFADYSQFIAYTIFFILKLMSIDRDPKTVDIGQDDIENVCTILSVIILTFIILKYLHIIQVYDDFGLQSELIAQVMLKIVPFMSIFIAWTCFFAFQLQILRSNTKTAKETPGVNSVVGYLIIAFQNGIMGNIENPTTTHWEVDGKETFSAILIIYILYIIWFLQQFVLGIVLLNFVVAYISQIYEDVMNQKYNFLYVQRQMLNSESQRFKSYALDFKCFKDYKKSVMNQMILINSKLKTGENEWLGIVQTLKTYIREHVVTKLRATDRKQDECQTKVSGIREEVDDLKTSVAEMRKEFNTNVDNIKVRLVEWTSTRKERVAAQENKESAVEDPAVEEKEDPAVQEKKEPAVHVKIEPAFEDQKGPLSEENNGPSVQADASYLVTESGLGEPIQAEAVPNSVRKVDINRR